MFSFDRIDVQRTAVSAVGAIALSAACVFGAISSAKAAGPDAVSVWQHQVGKQLDRRLAESGANWAGKKQATVRVSLDDAGAVTKVGMVESSGDARLDDVALETAAKVTYPALPGARAGQPTTVAVKLYFGQRPDRTELAKAGKDLRDASDNHHQRIQFAAL